MNARPCGCCAGTETATPAPTYNRPGLPALARRVGTHGRFFESMLARLSGRTELADLTTRDPDDPAIALLDGWAVIADVLTFYQERIANEGYLRTATEPESLVELGRLVGYEPRPPLGSSTYLAYTLDPGSRTRVPAGSQARSVPGQGELPQTFETTADLDARDEWSALAVRRTAPAQIDAVAADSTLTRFTVAGTAANLKAADRVLFLFGAAAHPVARTVAAAEPDFTAGNTAVTLVPVTMETGGLGGARIALQDAVTSAGDTAPPSGWTADTVTTLGTLSARLRDAMTKPADDVPGWLPPLDLVDVLPALAEQAALARLHARCHVTQWFDTQVAAVVAAGTTVLALASAALRTAHPEMADLTDLAYSIDCPYRYSPGDGAGFAAGTYPYAPGDDCFRSAALIGLTPLLAALRKPPSRPPASARNLPPDVGALFAGDSDVHPKLLALADPRLGPTLYRAWAKAEIGTPLPLAGVQVMRVKARPFLDTPLSVVDDVPGLTDGPHTRVQRLDAVYDGIVPGSWVIAEGDGHVEVLQVAAVEQQVVAQTVGTAGATVNVPITVLTLIGSWIDVLEKNITLWAQGEPLQALGDPLTADVQGDRIELAGPYDGLEPGRWLIVSGERTDVPYTSGVQAGELAMVGGVRQRVDPDVPGDTVHATLVLTDPLAYSYKRDTVRLHGNVVAATQGETRNEVLGSGDATRPNQSFTLRQVSERTPLTWLPADNPLGAEDVLTVRVDGVRWHETDSLVWSGPTAHEYARRAGPEATAEVGFGDGRHGARPTSGTENVTGAYRVGAGRSGNIPGGQINQLASRPLGVNAVVNPLPATGGSDADGPEDTRTVLPLRLLALDRLLSVRDYADFTRARAGIGKASAQRLFDGVREVVHVTIAGADDVPVDPTSRLFTALEASLGTFGDRHLPVEVAVRELVLIVLSAGVRVHPDHSWDIVEPAVRAALLDVFGFARRELAEPAFLSAAVAAMQQVPGVDYVDVDLFGGIDGNVTPIELAQVGKTLSGAAPCVAARPARYEQDLHVVAGEDETLTTVARRYGLTLDELARLNRGLVSRTLHAGDVLVTFRGVRPAQLALLPDVPEALTLRRIP